MLGIQYAANARRVHDVINKVEPLCKIGFKLAFSGDDDYQDKLWLGLLNNQLMNIMESGVK